VIVLYGTGEGPTTPSGIDGEIASTTAPPKPLQAVSVTIGGQPATVEYAGSVPGIVAGLLQINARIPAGIPAGAAAVIVTIGTSESSGAVTIAVQ